MSGTVSSPLVEVLRAPWWLPPGCRLSVGAFFLPLLLVAAVAVLAGEVLADRMLTARPPVIMTGNSEPVAEEKGMQLRVKSGAGERADRTANRKYPMSLE